MRKDIEQELKGDIKLITVEMMKVDLKNIIYDLKTKIEEYKNHEYHEDPAMQSAIKYHTLLYKRLETQLKNK